MIDLATRVAPHRALVGVAWLRPAGRFDTEGAAAELSIAAPSTRGAAIVSANHLAPTLGFQR